MAEQPPQVCDIILPDLGLPNTPIFASIWFRQDGEQVVEGERILEIVAGNAVIDLPAPANGVLIEQLIEEEDLLEIGQLLGRISCSRNEPK